MRKDVVNKLDEFEEKHKYSKQLRQECSQERLFGENGVAIRNQKAADKFDEMKKDAIAK